MRVSELSIANFLHADVENAEKLYSTVVKIISLTGVSIK